MIPRTRTFITIHGYELNILFIWTAINIDLISSLITSREEEFEKLTKITEFTNDRKVINMFETLSL